MGKAKLMIPFLLAQHQVHNFQKLCFIFFRKIGPSSDDLASIEKCDNVIRWSRTIEPFAISVGNPEKSSKLGGIKDCDHFFCVIYSLSRVGNNMIIS